MTIGGNGLNSAMEVAIATPVAIAIGTLIKLRVKNRIIDEEIMFWPFVAYFSCVDGSMLEQTMPLSFSRV